MNHQKIRDTLYVTDFNKDSEHEATPTGERVDPRHTVPAGAQEKQETAEDTRLTHTHTFCPKGGSPYGLVTWKKFHPILKGADGNVVFEQEDVEAPNFWSERAVRIVAQKYFRGQVGTPERETSVRQLVHRVVSKICLWLQEQSYFKTNDDLRAFGNDLAYLILTQHGTFNSPVWFNLGVEGVPQQASACFISSVEDDMTSIADLQHAETMIFKRGSGNGTNLSALRSNKERLSGGGTASGPLSFMEGLDSWGGVVKSGGTTRRSAAMRILNVDHPDIFEFIKCKLVEEEKAQTLIAAGYDPHFDSAGGAYASIKFQNANHSVRIPDEFMKALEDAWANPDKEVLWDLTARTTGEVIESVPVTALWNAICEAAWSCGDPGVQYDSIHNRWHCCPVDGRINSCNPCVEFTFLDDTSCNLASFNLLRFRKPDGTFDWDKFRTATRIFIIAQDAIVEKAHYPTQRLTETTKKYHTLGLGYANLGAYLMASGLAYDSDEGRKLAAHITSELTATAYVTSAELARAVGPFEAFERNRTPMLEIIAKHGDAALMNELPTDTWKHAYDRGEAYGFRNAQVTVLAPTGTIAFMMDCDTTGCEPDISLVKTKHLVGGGVEVMENRVVDMALQTLGYSETHRTAIMEHLREHGDLENSSVADAHRSVFDCALANKHGTGELSLYAHLNMLAALQPFISGSISKTVNIANSATVEDMSKAYYDAWKLGIKSVAIYRDGCKQSQPVQTNKAAPDKESPAPVTIEAEPGAPVRRKLLDHQDNMHRIKIKFANVKGYVLVTPYKDTGLPGELFVKLAKEGSTISGLVDGWAQAISFCLQYGVPFATLVQKFSNMKFEPLGWSPDPDIRQATSIYDAVMRKLGAVFLPDEEQPEVLNAVPNPNSTEPVIVARIDAPACHVCGTLMVQSGATCYSCPSCGNSTGCG